jgi:hypothetical protein
MAGRLYSVAFPVPILPHPVFSGGSFMTAVLRRLASNTFVHMLAAFVVMGCWAFHANRHFPRPQPLVSGLVQGMLSALLALFLKSAVDFLARRFQGWAALLAPPAIAGLGSACLLVIMHMISGTPNVLRTVIVPLLVSVVYSSLYNYAHVRQRSPAG